MSIMQVVDGGMSMGLVSVVKVQFSKSSEVSCHFGLRVLDLFVFFEIFIFL